MPNVKFDRFYRYPELTRILKEYAKEYPNLIRLESIGKSHEGRDVWLITATNFKSGKDTDELGFFEGPCSLNLFDVGDVCSDLDDSGL